MKKLFAALTIAALLSLGVVAQDKPADKTAPAGDMKPKAKAKRKKGKAKAKTSTTAPAAPAAAPAKKK